MNSSQIINSLINLNRDKNPNIWDERTKTGAPHKPLLLLSIMDGIENGWIISSHFQFNDSIGETFFDYWENLFDEKRETSIALPLYHMKSEPFWKLIYKQGEKEFTYSPSLGALLKRVESFEIDQNMFQIMSDPSENKKLRFLLFENYFSDEIAIRLTKTQELITKSYSYSNSLLSMVADPFYLDHNDSPLKFSAVHKPIRSKGFSRVIRNNFNDKCAICGDRIITPNGNSLVDAAHIIPWSDYKNDDPRNGLSLCKSHHWMFDNFMLTIDKYHKIKISKYLNIPDNIISGLEERKGKKILLPDNPNYYPAIEAILLHNKRFKEIHEKWY